jgi:hypothetical protein
MQQAGSQFFVLQQNRSHFLSKFKYKAIVM